MLLRLAAFLTVQAPSCPDAASCRAEAEAAANRGEFETFHDLAWRAVQKSRPNDPALMFLLARAQALSGRPDDAIVMLGRLADLHAPVDLALHDFDRARLRPGWAALESRVAGGLVQTAPAQTLELLAPRAPGAPVPGIAGPPARPSIFTPGPVAADTVIAVGAVDFDPPANLGPVAIAHDAVSRRFVIGDAPSRRLLVVDEVSRHVVPY